MRPETAKLLYDIGQACQLLLQFTEGKNYDDYISDPLLRSGVERQFEIMGEALNKALQKEPGLADKITDHKRIIDFRNFLIHDYASVNDLVVWGIIEKHLPLLHQEVQELLSKYKV